MEILKLDPRDCTRWEYADRSIFEFGDTNALALDIKTNGQINPIFVRTLENNKQFKYEVVAGSRRFQACLSANIMIDAILVDVSDEKAAIIQFKENDKIPLSEYSKGLAFAKLQKNNKFNQDQLAEIVGCSRKKIYSLLAFDKVDPKIWNAVGNMSKVSAKSAEAIFLLSKKSDAHKEALIDIADDIKKGAGHRRITNLVNNIVSGDTQGAEEEIVESKSGQVLAKWKDGKLYFAKDLNLDKKKFNKMLISFFHAQNA